MDIRDIHETLGIEHLGQVKLDDLATKIEQAAPEKINRSQILKIMMGWLHEQIKGDIVMQNGLLCDFVNLLYDSGTCSFTEEEIMQAFEERQKRDAGEDPTNRRRYLIAKDELQQLFGQAPSRSIASNNSSHPQDFSGQHIHKSRAARLQNPHIQEPLEDISNKEREKDTIPTYQRKTGANVLPLGQRKTLTSSKQETSGTNNEKPQYNDSYTTPKKNPSCHLPGAMDSFPDLGLEDLSITKEITKEADLRKSSEKMTWSSDIGKGSDSDQKKRYPYGNGSMDLSLTPPSKYICKRCDRPGHWIQLCPTNLDPTWDRPPPRDYRCEICREVGKHFATLCPLNQKSVSLTKQRERAGINAESPIQVESRRYRDRRSPSLAYERERSISPTRSSRRAGYDAYRPGGSTTVPYEGFTRGSRARPPFFDSPPRNRRVRRIEKHREYEPTREEATNYNPRDHKTLSIRTGGSHGSGKARHIARVGMRTEEGRLSYDDDIFIDSERFLQTPKAKRTARSETDDRIPREGDVLEDARPEHMLTPAEIEQARQDTDRFLRELEAEILADQTSAKNTGSRDPSEEVMVGTVYDDADMMDINEVASQHDSDTSAGEVDLTAFEAPDGIRYRLVTETQFRPEVLALFKARANPIINSRKNRRTACQMWGELNQQKDEDMIY